MNESNETASSGAWFLGAVLFLAGVIGLVCSFNMDTTVAVPPGIFAPGPQRVHNIGLMHERQNYLMLSGGTAALGIMIVVLSELFSKKQSETRQIQHWFD
jgi:hypothetical protein